MSSREYYQKNKEKVKARQRDYYARNKEKIKASSNAWYHRTKETRREAILASSRRSYRKNREQKLAYNKKLWQNLRFKVLEAAGGARCVNCGFSDWRALQVDHVNGGGTKEMRENRTYNNPRVYAKIIKESPEKYQVLCANCNWIKRYEKKEHRQKAVFKES